MNKIVLSFLLVLISNPVYAQHTLLAFIKDEGTGEPLVGATAYIESLNVGATADSRGLVQLSNIPPGTFEVIFRYIGYVEKEESVTFPVAGGDTLTLFLKPKAEELEEVTVSSTRSNRTIANIPTRVETITAEELDEKTSTRPSDIREMLNESSGVLTQQTSAATGNASIRIQGLDGRYTQFLKDGFPLYSGFAGTLSVLQIAPLDLKQVEVIKGSASTLYGGGAIAGLVNLISKTPADKGELSVQLNGTTTKGLDVNSFYSGNIEHIGITALASFNRNAAYDPAGIGFSAIPDFQRFTFNPKLFFSINPSTTLWTGINATTEKSRGGDIDVIEDRPDTQHRYFENNRSDRYSSQLKFDHTIDGRDRLELKNSVSYFNRGIDIPGYSFSGRQWSTFSEASDQLIMEHAEIVTGLNLWTDNFQETSGDTFPTRDYKQVVAGAFVQSNWDISNWLTVEAGFRGDHVSGYGFVPLPRVSLLVKANERLTGRIGGGLGYKVPSIFTENAEEQKFRNILPIDVDHTKLETSTGGNFDVNYRMPLFGQIAFSINQLLFYTRLTDPLILAANSLSQLYFKNGDGFIDSKGTETNIRLDFEELKLYAGYTFTEVNSHYGGVTAVYPLTPKHRILLTVSYEEENNWRAGTECFYYGSQNLSDGSSTRDYWLVDLAVQKIFEHITLYLNAENSLDIRETRFEPIYTGSISAPVFKEIYAPLDGVVVNAGVKLRL